MTTYITLKDIAKEVRADLKKEFPDCKFSVRTEYFSMGQALHVSLMSAPFEAYPEILPEFNFYCDESDVERYRQRLEGARKDGHSQCSQYSLEDGDRERLINNGVPITKECFECLKRVCEISNKHNWDRSEPMTDYFDVNYYFHLNIGQWDKPFKRI